MRVYVDPQRQSHGAVVVCDVQGRPLSAQVSTTNLYLCVGSFAAPVSGIAAHDVVVYDARTAETIFSRRYIHRTWPESSAISPHPYNELAATSPTGEDVVGEGLLQLTGLTLRCGWRYYAEATPISGASVRATDGDASGTTTVAEMSVDCTPPIAAASVVLDVPAPLGSGWSSYDRVCVAAGTAEVLASWTEFSDAESGVQNLTVQTVSSGVATDAPHGVGLRRSTTIFAADLALAPDARDAPSKGYCVQRRGALHHHGNLPVIGHRR